ncbi:hypothetical protein ABES23_17535 [Peribacillus frigoritolerans]|uniref:hypothetical protein n=1 Tax=Peribacillus frigoritolerans TaxID=450367 RepID=UPI003D265E82
MYNGVLPKIYNKTRLSFMFFTVIFIGLNKYATLLPIYWLAGHRSRFDLAWQTIGGKGMDF